MPSNERTTRDSLSVRLFRDDTADAAKTWLERSIQLAPRKEYSVNMRFDLASVDHAKLNLFSILANVLPHQPTRREDVISGVQAGDFPEGTYNGGVQGFAWVEKSISRAVVTDESGPIHFILGHWGTWKSARTYHFGNLKITVAES